LKAEFLQMSNGPWALLIQLCNSWHAKNITYEF